MGNALKTGFDCRVCGLHHDALPLSYSYKIPAGAAAVPRDAWDRRLVVTPDQCVIDDRFHYLRGRFAIPVRGLDEPFIWGVWARVPGPVFFRTHQLWSDAERVHEPMYDGVLDNALPVYGDVTGMAVRIQTMAVGRRPHFFPAEESHPLAREIREGVPLDRVVQFAEQLLHFAG